MYLFFDTETTGTPKNYKAKMTDLNNWPRIIQLAAIMYDKDGSILAEQCDLIRPDGWTVPTGLFWVKHGFSQEKSVADGVDIRYSLEKFLACINACDYVVAHNINFDYNVAGAEMIRAGLKAAIKPQQICTMNAGTDLCKLPGNYGYKWPSLEELHYHLFGELMVGAHNALNDVKAGARCFFAMKEQGVIQCD
jgi:DNA polymerase-3 subunit epsilon